MFQRASSCLMSLLFRYLSEINNIYSYDGTSNRISETWQNNQNQIISQYTYTYQPGDYLISKTDPSSVVNYTWDIYGQLSSKSSGENYIFTGKRNLNTVTESNIVKELLVAPLCAGYIT